MTSIPSGLVRSDRDRAQQPRVRCQPLPPLSKGAHMRVTLSLFTLPLHFPCSQFCGLYLAGGLQISSLLFFLSPPLPSPFPSIVPPEVFMGRTTGCSAHQEIKVSSSSQCAIARCDLFNSNRVNITDACKAGITVAELDVLRRDTG